LIFRQPFHQSSDYQPNCSEQRLITGNPSIGDSDGHQLEVGLDRAIFTKNRVSDPLKAHPQQLLTASIGLSNLGHYLVEGVSTDSLPYSRSSRSATSSGV
jgi:hypothetical protein